MLDRLQQEVDSLRKMAAAHKFPNSPVEEAKYSPWYSNPYIEDAPLTFSYSISSYPVANLSVSYTSYQPPAAGIVLSFQEANPDLKLGVVKKKSKTKKTKQRLWPCPKCNQLISCTKNKIIRPHYSSKIGQLCRGSGSKGK